MQEMDYVCYFSSTLNQLITSKEQKPDKKAMLIGALDQNHHGENLTLLDYKTGESVVMAKIRHAKKMDDYEGKEQTYEAVEINTKKVILDCILFEDDDDLISFEMNGQEYKFMLREKYQDRDLIRKIYD